MKIYIAHPSDFDYQKQLYTPLLTSELNKEHVLVFPKMDRSVMHEKVEIASATLLIAEVSRPSTGMGIELGWADSAKIPIVCIYSEGSKPSTALKAISTIFIQYSGAKDMIDKIITAITAVRSTM